MQSEASSQTTATLVALAEIGEATNQALPLDTILNRVATTLMDLVGGDVITLALLDRQRQVMILRASIDNSGASISDRIGKVIPVQSLKTIQTVLETKSPLYIPDVVNSPLWQPRLHTAYSVRAFIGVPLQVEDEIAGMLFVDFNRLDPLTDEVRYTLLAFARFASAAIHNAQQRERLQRSEERYRIASSLTSNAIYEWQIGSEHVQWSGDIEALLQYEKGKFPYTMDAWIAVIHPNDRMRVVASREALMTTGTRFEEEYRMRRTNGNYCHVLDRGLIFESDTSSGHYVLGALTDLTNTYELTDALVESEVRYRTLFARALDAIFVIDISGNILDFNPAAEALCGRNYSGLVSTQLSSLLAPVDGENYRAALRRMIERGEVSAFDVQFQHPDGKLVDAEMWGSALGDGLHQFVARDTSTRKANELLAAQRAAELTAISDVTRATTAASDAIVMFRNVLPGAMNALEMTLGCVYLVSNETRELELITSQGFNADQAPPVHLPMSACDQGRLAPASTLVRILDNFENFPSAEVGLQVPLIANSKVTGLIVFLHTQERFFHTTDIHLMDIIGRQLGIGIENVRLLDNLEQIVEERTVALFRTETRYKSLIEQVPGVVYTADTVFEGIGFISSAASELFGIDPATIISSENLLEQRIRPEDRAEVQELVNRATSSGGDFDAQYRITHSQTGMERWVHHHARLIMAGTGETFWLGLLTDVTKLKELDDLKNQFVATVSHELRTPLSAIKLRAATLSNYYQRLTDDQRIDMIQRISYQADILAALIEDVLRLAKLESGNLDRLIEDVDLNAICSDVVEELGPTAEMDRLSLIELYANHPCTIKADVTEIARIWRNLISNAIKYTPAGGTVKVYTGYVKTGNSHDIVTSTLPESCAVIPENISAGNWMVGVVEDTGKGISPHDQAHIFVRFFRGEAAQTSIPGTGLGLSLVKELIDDYGGYIALSSTLGKGSTFAFWMPAIKASEIRK
jgi:PAS domain S-box-containing protein